MEELDRKAKQLHNYLMLLGRAMEQTQAGCCMQNDCLHPRELKTIEFVAMHQPVMMKKLADWLQMAVSSVTYLVDKMETKGLLKRVASAEDRRVVEIVLTDQGKAIGQSEMAAWLDACKLLLLKLNEDEQDQLLKLFAKLTGKA